MRNDIPILFDEFMKSKIVNHNDSINTYVDGIKYLIDSKADIISYNTQKNLTLFNIDSLDFFEYTIEIQADIIDNIHVISSNDYDDVIMKFIIGDKEYDIVNTIIKELSPYREFKLKLIFTKPKLNDNISIYYTNYIINSELKKI